MLKLKNAVRKYACVPCATGLISVAGAFPALAAGTGDTGGGDLAGMLAIFTQVAAWLWKEVGLFATFVFSQPLLMLAFSVTFVSLIVGMFMRIFRTA